ncbi:hypothetical protein ABW21_db0208358 [Orbilia brochopaga]|nr:hypothetical protein ABW21_db0208358 [Drechslerella brochopaga]
MNARLQMEEEEEEEFVYEMAGNETLYTFLASDLLANISSSNRGTLRQQEREERRKAVEKRKEQREANQAARWRLQYTNVVREVAHLSHQQDPGKQGRAVDARTANRFIIPAAWRADAPPPVRQMIAPPAPFICAASRGTDVHMTGAGSHENDVSAGRKIKYGKPPRFLENEKQMESPSSSPFLNLDGQIVLTSPRKARGRNRQTRGTEQQRDERGRFAKGG